MSKDIIMLEYLSKFYKSHDRIPSKDSSDSNEKSLGKWYFYNKYKIIALSNQDKHFSKKLIDLGLGHIFIKSVNLELTDVNTLLEVSEFYKIHTRLPSQYAKDVNERRLYKWIVMKRNAKKGDGESVWYPILEKKLKKLKLPLDMFDVIDVELDPIVDISNFYKTNNRLPSQHTKDLRESYLGNWINTKRQSKKGNGTKWHPELEDRLPELGLPTNMFDSIDADSYYVNKQYITIFEVSDFYKSTGKLPSSSSKDPIEKRLGIWINNHKKSKKGIGTGKWYPELEDRLPELGLPLNLFNYTDKKEHAINILYAVSEFYKSNGKLPSQRSKDVNEDRLGAWINTQKQAKKGINKCIWYPILEIMLSNFGLPLDMFD